MNRSLNESQTRQQFIDQQLAHAGWGVEDRKLVAEYGIAVSEEEDSLGRVIQRFADYVLLGRDGRLLAIVEAKRTSRDALAGKRQAAEHADLIQAQLGIDPFIFLANGEQILFWDRERYPEREVSGFFTRSDLERLSHQKRYGTPLNRMEINSKIADRDYQIEAIRRITEAIEAARRKFLLVMATGTGKTRTIIALIDLLLRAKRVQQVLFLADRRELVRQATIQRLRVILNSSAYKTSKPENSTFLI
jgi:type I restriction enzyme R subunit